MYLGCFCRPVFLNMSMSNKMYASLLNSSGKGPAKSNYTLSWGSTTGSIWNDCFLLTHINVVLNFHISLCSVGSFEPFVQWSGVNRGTRYVHTDLTSLRLRGLSSARCERFFVAVVKVLRFAHVSGGSHFCRGHDFLYCDKSLRKHTSVAPSLFF